MSLRARVMTLVLCAVVPALGLTLYTALEARRLAREDATAEMRALLRVAIGRQQELLSGTRQLLTAIAELPAVVELGREGRCSDTLARLHKPYPYYTNLGVATSRGEVVCSALPIERPISIADRTYFGNAVSTRELAIGEYQIGRLTGKPTIGLGYPVLDAVGSVKAVVFAAVDLAWVGKLLADLEAPAGSALTVVDNAGTVLARHPDAAAWVGKKLPDAPIVRAVLAQGKEDFAEFAGVDGVVRLYAFAPLDRDVDSSAYLVYGIPPELVYGKVDQAFVRNVGLLALLVIVLLAATWWGSKVFVTRRVEILASAAQRLGEGDLGARAGLPRSGDELGRLAQTFDTMAETIERREAEIHATNRELQRVNRALTTLSAGNRALVGATEEPALLQEICRVAVEVGGYRMAWVGIPQNDPERRIRLVAAAGVVEGYFDQLRLSWEDNEYGQGPTATALRTGQPQVAHDIANDPRFVWREAAMVRGFASSLSLPLRFGGECGVLSIYAAEQDAFGPREVELLQETAADLAFGITTLRARARQREADDYIRRLAYSDGVTGLASRLKLEETLHERIEESRATNGSFALLALDLNRLRDINEAIGYSAGDELLKEAGQRLAREVAAPALVARVGAGTFAVLLPGSDADEAARTMQRLRTALEDPVPVAGLSVYIEASGGIALFPAHGAQAHELVRYAVQACYAAKSTPSGVLVYRPGTQDDGARRLALAAELRRALERGELELHYQPKIDLATRRVCGAEGLARWRHPQHGMVPPVEFIAVAERTGLIWPLTDWALETAVRQIHAWCRAGANLVLAVNLSARNLRDPHLLDGLERHLAAWGVEPGWLELEITESALMEDPEGAREVLTRLSERGFKLYIDDFGTGYSSLAYLKRLPVDAIKIDKSFVFDMTKNEDSAHIVRSTIDLAHGMELKVVAEGVEDAAALERLIALGCDTAQGYFFGKPMPASDIVTWLGSSAWGRQERAVAS